MDVKNSMCLNVPFQFINPEKLQSGLDLVRGSMSSSAILSSDINTLNGTQRIPIGSIFFTKSYTFPYSQCGQLPDYIISELADLLPFIEEKNGGYISEFLSDRKKTYFHANSINSKLTGEKNIEIPLFSGGRYYARNDVRSNIDALSERIIKNKEKDDDFSIFANSYEALIKYVVKEKADGITRVPPKIGETYDRFNRIVNRLCDTFGFINHSSSLCVDSGIKSQKSLTSYERIENVKDKYSFTDDVDGETILLIDDVITTGATVIECAKKMYEKGARKVIALTIAVNQYTNPWLNKSLSLPICPDCGRPFHIRIRKADRSLFFGCKGFPNCEKLLNSQDWLVRARQCIDNYHFSDYHI